jgi:polysaccharide export outer membrane protein
MTEPVKTSALGQADRDRTTGRQFLPRRLGWLGMAILLAAAWPMIWNANGKVAPTGVATPAGPRQAGFRPARVASITPEERHFCHWSVAGGQWSAEEKKAEGGGRNCGSLLGSSFILHPSSFTLCQALGPAAPYDVRSVDCFAGNCRRAYCEFDREMAWQAYAQGEYVGHDRLAHVPEYRLRVDDQLDMTYRLTRDETTTPYRLNVGDEVRVESFTDPEINRDLIIQPDGTITLRLLGQVRATGRTVTQLRDSLDSLYRKYYTVPSITVTPLKVDTKLEDLRATIDRRAGIGGQSQAVRVTPEGTVSLPGIGSVQAQGLTLTELQTELNECYRQLVEGIQVIPALIQRAPRYVFVMGEVNSPGRYELSGPTTVLQSLSMAGSWRVGANLRQIVVFRRGDDWRLLATTVNLEGALLGNQLCPRDEIWVDDSDVIIVPKSPILVADDFINLVFTRGIYGVFPMYTTLNFSKLSSL